MTGRFLLAAWVCFTAGGLGVWAEPAPHPPAPADWKERVLPGFEPSLESVLARGGFFPDDYAREAWKNWGPEAVEGFFTLLNDPSWGEFRVEILRMLFLSPHPVAQNRLEQAVRAMISGGHAKETGRELFNCIGLFARYWPGTSLPFLKELAESPQQDVRVAAGCALAGLATDESLAAAREMLSELSGNSRYSLEWHLWKGMGKNRAREMMSGPPKAADASAGVQPEAPKQPGRDKGMEGWRREMHLRAESAVKGGDYEAALKEWNTCSPEIIEKVVRAMDKSGQRGLERVLLAHLRLIAPVMNWNSRQATVLARVAAALESDDAVPFLQAAFSAIKIEANSLVEPATEEIMDALVRLRGEKMTDYFESMAGAAKNSKMVRVHALIALGRIGTDKSVAAFKRLRDAAYGKNGAPERRPAYTHGERMAESAAMTLHYIPGEAGPAPASLDGEKALVSADYTEGEMYYPHYEVHFRRYGDEWMPVRMIPLPII